VNNNPIWFLLLAESLNSDFQVRLEGSPKLPSATSENQTLISIKTLRGVSKWD